MRRKPVITVQKGRWGEAPRREPGAPPVGNPGGMHSPPRDGVRRRREAGGGAGLTRAWGCLLYTSFRVNVFTETRNCAPLYLGNIVQCFANAVRCLVGAKSCIVTTLRALRLLMSEERVKKVWVRGLPADELGDLNKALSSSNAYVINDYGVVEIGSVESSKLAAVNLILKEKRVDPSHVYVVGDDGNDIGLLRSYPNSFAVANSRSEVMEAASYVVSSNNDCGVAEVVERIEADRKSEKAWS